LSIIEALGGVITNGKIPIRKAHDAQRPFVESEAKRIIVKAGRRGGKTVGAAIKAVRAFNKGLRVLYAAPTSEQTDAFWFEVCRSLAEPIADGVLKKLGILTISGETMRMRLPLMSGNYRMKLSGNKYALLC